MNERKMELFCRVGGRDKELAAAGRAGEAAVYENGCLQALLHEESLGEGRKRLICEWKNRTDAALSCQLELRIRTDFVFDHYVIPGVSVNGNHWGKGKEPKGWHGTTSLRMRDCSECLMENLKT